MVLRLLVILISSHLSGLKCIGQSKFIKGGYRTTSSTSQIIQDLRWAPQGQGVGGGGTLIFSYIHRLGSFFWSQNFEFHFFGGGGVQKNKYFLGVMILWIFFGEFTKLDYI